MFGYLLTIYLRWRKMFQLVEGGNEKSSRSIHYILFVSCSNRSHDCDFASSSFYDVMNNINQHTEIRIVFSKVQILF